jgi:hypothetical protein
MFDPNLQSKEQAKRDLSWLMTDWTVRLEAAKKMRKELDEAHHQEKEERSVLKRHADKVDQRKEEARRRRERRLGTHSESDGNTAAEHIAPDGVGPKQIDAQKKKSQEPSEIHEDATGLSTIKPRNLLGTLSQTSHSQHDDDAAVADMSMPSSQKKVTWRQDSVAKAGSHHSGSKKERTQKHASKTFGGNSAKPNPFLSTRKTSKPPPGTRTDKKFRSVKETNKTSGPVKTSHGRRLELAESKGQSQSDEKRASSKEDGLSSRVTDKGPTGKGKIPTHSKRHRSSFSKPSKRVGPDLLGASALRVSDASSKAKDSNTGRVQDSSTKTKKSKSMSKKDAFRSKTSDIAAKSSKRESSTTKTLDGGSKSERSSKSATSSAKRSRQISGISSTEQRATKQRRRGVTKVAGTKSFGEDVGFSF